VSSLQNNTTGSFNTANGQTALASNTTGADNTAVGQGALNVNTQGSFNTATGLHALLKNTTGNGNTAGGLQALQNNTTGASNTAVGFNALENTTTGSNNLGLGTNAGVNLTTGSNNIDIGSVGVAAESKTIRLGTQGTQTAAFIAGVFGSVVTGDAVVVSNTGKLGIVTSSARYKRDVHKMGIVSDGLMKLRPVTFRYKQDPKGERQYGLIAEEVARVYPELVSYDTDGKVITVRYHELVPMLLNETQKQADQIEKQAQQIERLNAKVAEGKAERASFEQRLSALEQTRAARDPNQILAAALVR